MKTFFEIEQLLHEHHEEYRGFTRLLITLSVAFITLLAAVLNKGEISSSIFIKGAIIFHLSSLVFGLIVQHRIMMNPIYQLDQAKTDVESAAKNQDPSPIKMRRKPSAFEIYCYRLQLGSFVSGFVSFSSFLLASNA